MTVYIEKVKSRLHCDIIMFCRNTLLVFIQHRNSGTDGKAVSIFHIWLNTGLMTLVLVAHLETVEIL